VADITCKRCPLSQTFCKHLCLLFAGAVPVINQFPTYIVNLILATCVMQVKMNIGKVKQEPLYNGIKNKQNSRREGFNNNKKQAGAELCQAQVRLGLAKPAIAS
jgi:hypothetical protein